MCCLRPPKTTTMLGPGQSLGGMMTSALPPPKSPDARLTHPWTGSLPTSSSSCSGLAPTPACPAPRLRHIPRWGRSGGVSQVPAGRKQQKGCIAPGTVPPLRQGGGLSRCLSPLPPPPPFKMMPLPPEHVTSLLKGSPLPGPGQEVRAEGQKVGSVDRLPAASIPTLSLPAVRPQARDFISLACVPTLGK